MTLVLAHWTIVAAPLPKYGESGNDGDNKSNVSLHRQAGNIQESLGGLQATPPVADFKRIRYYVARSGVAC